MQIIKSVTLSHLQKQRLMALWNKEYPRQLSYESIAEFDQYLVGLGPVTHYLIIQDPGPILGWAFTFSRKQELWFAIIIDSAQQHQGLGSHLISTLKAESTALKGWVVDHDRYKRPDGRAYPSPLTFYLKNGFSLVPESRLENIQLTAVQIQWKV